MAKRTRTPKLLDQLRGFVREYIEQSEISQSELARRIDVDKGPLSRFLNGHGSLQGEKLERLAEIIGLELTRRK